MKKRKKGVSVLISAIIIAGAVCLIYFFVLSQCQLDYKNEISKYAKEYELEPYFLAAIIKTESNFNKDAASSKGALGLMQITEDTEVWISKRLGEVYEKNSVLEPEKNIRYGSWYIKYLIDKYDGNQNLAILAYNAGFGNVDKWITEKKITGRFLEFQNIPFKETRNYLVKTRIYSVLYKYLYDWKS